MTTIAFDSRYLAGDGCLQRADAVVSYDNVKVWLGREHAYAAMGASNWDAAWFRWAEAGCDPHNLPPHGAGADACGGFMRVSVATPRELAGWDHRFPYLDPQPVASAAFGTGREFAQGALDRGANAMEAVQAAAQRDPATKGVITYIDLDNPAQGVQAWHELADYQVGGTVRRKWPVDQWAGAATEIIMGEYRAPADGIPIAKPRPALETGAWSPECTGRLVLGTGCGSCLRCNREFRGLLKGYSVTTESGELFMSSAQVANALKQWPDAARASASAWKADNELGKRVEEIVLAAGQLQKNGIPMAMFQIAYPDCRDLVSFEYHVIRQETSFPTKDEAIDNWAKQFTTWLRGQPRGTIHWRTLPELMHQVNFMTGKDEWKAYGRMVVVPNNLMAMDLDAWVQAWNAASIECNEAEMQRLNVMLRSMTFPTGVELIMDTTSLPVDQYMIKQV